MKRIIKIDPYLTEFEKDIELRHNLFKKKKAELCGKNKTLYEFADGYDYFGFHRTQDGGYVYREWAPAAQKMYLTGDFCNWDIFAKELTDIGSGVFEIFFEKDVLSAGQKVQTIIVDRDGKVLRRVPAYATRVVQDPQNYLWCAELEAESVFKWTDSEFEMPENPLIYECHIGMAQEEGKVGSYAEFTENILPRIKAAGYNTIQIMAIMEHPYYGSFGYQVSNFFAPSSRFGKSDELRALVDRAHSLGIAVLLDVVHSHAVKNTEEGLSEFDGTEYQYFHAGARGNHSAWDTRLFDYGKNEVLHFLLSNLRYWMESFHFDGFRFDGVTSMLYHDHGLGSAFTDYSMYFSMNTDTEAVTYLQLANELVHSINKNAITIAEDMSGMPGMCLKISDGGIGFDYRLSMGVPDFWIKLIKEYTDENWDMWKLWHELSSKRPAEKTIGYCESHDQALVGDKTIMFRLCDANMYTGMSKGAGDYVIDRGIALHKMIRLITATVVGEGYLNFMGNEFGHPEWIDFPREGNGWSYHYCRRQWSLADNRALRYCELSDFDRAMIELLKAGDILNKNAVSGWIHQDDKVIIYQKGEYVFVFNFNPTRSFEGYFVPTCSFGTYSAVLSTDDGRFGGQDRIDTEYKYKAVKTEDGRRGFLCYLPQRSAAVYKKIKRGEK